MRRPRMWDKRQIVLPRLFCIHTFYQLTLLTIDANIGEVRAEGKSIMEVLYHGQCYQLSDEAKRLLDDINDVWKELQQEPNGTCTPGGIYLSPCNTTYYSNLNKLGGLLEKLNTNLPFSIIDSINEFYHTKNKEGSYLKNYHNKEKDLVDCMCNINGHINRDLYTIFHLNDNIQENVPEKE